MSGRPVELLESWARANQADSLPIVTLPSGSVTITECAEALFGEGSVAHRVGVLSLTISRYISVTEGSSRAAVGQSSYVEL